ncbi:Glyoxylate/hydroxypyruvate reductase HPR3 [Hibiscus syriacus]|uniref:Glyoxylate/hydroxypyruvate reductase HPR3 n=1 Tax=Hibiscus syriacus TaxID=106335 RepID=A0A6A2YWM7_HIBSY|nr:Glyoxylate/hydroxypyruvate reductase HPR3 [Hibiscus syriacus]
MPPFFFKSQLQAHFHLLDPLDSSEPYHSFLTRHAPSVLALLCVGNTPVSSETLSLLPSLKLVVGSSAGLDHIDLHECRRRGIAVTDAGQAFSEDVADFAVGLLIDVFIRMSAGDRYVRSGSWVTKGTYRLGGKSSVGQLRPSLPPLAVPTSTPIRPSIKPPLDFCRKLSPFAVEKCSKLSGKRNGIVGLGRIGSEVAKRLVAFGCSIAYCSRKEKPLVPYAYYSTVNDLAKNSDGLILCFSLTKETHHMIDSGVMEALGKEGVVINIGRGALIDEKELVKSLVQGRIGGASLDVYEDEPSVPQELFAMENVVLARDSNSGTQTLLRPLFRDNATVRN